MLQPVQMQICERHHLLRWDKPFSGKAKLIFPETNHPGFSNILKSLTVYWDILNQDKALAAISASVQPKTA